MGIWKDEKKIGSPQYDSKLLLENKTENNWTEKFLMHLQSNPGFMLNSLFFVRRLFFFFFLNSKYTDINIFTIHASLKNDTIQPTMY